MSSEWKDMKLCVGAVPSLSQRYFRDCGNPVSVDSHELLPLCAAHLRNIQADMTRALREQIAQLQADVAKSRGEIEADLLALHASRHEAVQEKAAEARGKRSRIYFMRCASFIKIGYTTQLATRLNTIRKSGGVLMPSGLPYWTTELVHAFHGAFDEEKELHQQFAHLRHTGEWFTESKELTDYIEGLAQ